MNRLINIARAAALAGLCSGCIVWSAAAFAADYEALPQGAIAVHEADFSSPGAVAHLKRKLDHVARNICTPNSDGGIMSLSEQACYDTAVKDGLAQIDHRQQQAQQLIGRDRTVQLADTGAARSSAQ